MPRYPRGLSRRKAGWRLSVQVKGELHQKCLPPSTTQTEAEAELLAYRARRKAPTVAFLPSSLAADVLKYLHDYYQGRPGYKEREGHLKLWLAALGKDTPRTAITRDDIARVLNGWRASGLAADTCNKRRTALLSLYHALDGKGASNPVREVPKFRPPAALPRGLTYTAIERVFRHLPECKTKARLMVIAYTGIRHGQLRALQPHHWDKRRKLLLVPATEKGRGTKPYVLPLSAKATKALKMFDRLKAWGGFSKAPIARAWKEAARKAKLPPDTVSYDLRHSFGTAIYRKTGDLKATKELLGHSSIRMTERYTVAAVSERRRKAIRQTFG